MSSAIGSTARDDDGEANDNIRSLTRHVSIADFIERYRGISFSKNSVVSPTHENIVQVLTDAGLGDVLVNESEVILQHWQELYLQELAEAIDENRQPGLHCVDNPLYITQHDVLCTEEYNCSGSKLNESQMYDEVLPNVNQSQTGASNWHLKRQQEIRNEGDRSRSTRKTLEQDHVSRASNNQDLTVSESPFNMTADEHIHAGNERVGDEWMNGEEMIMTSARGQEPGEQTDSGSMVSDWMEHNAHYANVTGNADNMEHTLIDQAKSDHGSIALDPRWWDRFQMMPREQVSNSATFQTVFKFFKVVCYIFIMIMVLTSAVVNKICVLIMTSSVTKDPLTESQWPVKTMLLISICFPYSIWFLVYSGKSVFGSTTWPSLSLLSSVLFIELLHTLGLSLLVFRVLPMLDMLRAFIVLGSIYTVPAFLKTIFEGRDPNTGLARKCSIFVLNFGAFLIQIGSIVLCEMFQISMSPSEKMGIRNAVLQDDLSVIVPRPNLGKGFFRNEVLFELPIALVLISVSYWENYVEGEFSIFGKSMNFKNWKKHLHHARGRLYIFASIWKACWVIAFAVLLQPGFNFNLSYTNPAQQNDTISPRSVRAIQHQGQNIFRDTRFTRREVDSDAPNATTIKTHVINFISETTSALVTTEAYTDVTSRAPNVNKSDPDQNMFYFSPETMQHFEEYGVFYIQIISSTLLAYFGGTACKLCMQMIGFSLPLSLTTPISVAVVVLQNIYEFLPTGSFVWIGVENGSNTWILHLAWLGVLWLSELYITSHIWFPGNGRMEKIDRLFITPIRCSIFADQSLILRRRRNDHDTSLTPDTDEDYYDPEIDQYKADDVVPQIYACATMWHETRAEMTNLLKSIFRMDIDHSGRYLAQKFYKIRDPDYYEFEAHIFFDDAMELSHDDLLVPNMFVADLLECIDDSLSSVHERQMSLGPPIRTPTPYGGRLTWRLPGGTRLIAHLKDKHKIRHKKRWSQVMYMYYLLGYRILAQPENLLTKDMIEGFRSDGELKRVRLTESQLRRRRKAAHFTRSVIFNYVTDEVHIQAENTYILTLDGDVDFHPDAVRLLVDRLKTNKKVGAACGRIHPIGSGPLLWYQQFEYAIGHWLQKATEHVFGCVMCAPGCFSLFRGSALMDDNVARTYATRATEAGHYVQYDQGEDRWLSTLLLQQGYRIDYCAASDALTHAPETFSEFFNQRRRWGPSTLANIVDLLGGWKAAISINDNISTLYILYQFCLMVSTILGPATILLMLAGAFVVVFKLTVIESYCLALIPAIFFIIVCIYAKPSTQMTIASIMSAVYAILMTVVLVGTVGQAIEGGVTSPNVVFLVMLVLIFFISAIMHPEEFFCVIPGALYFICLPTGYLLLTMYYLCNMNTVSWGTREVPKRKTKEQIAEEKRVAEENRKKREERKKGILGWMGLNSFFKDVGEVFKQLRTEASHYEKSKTDVLLEELIHEIRRSRENKDSDKLTPMRMPEIKPDTEQCNEEPNTDLVTEETKQEEDEAKSVKNHENSIPVWLQREDADNPGWLQSAICGDGPIKSLNEKESIFWKQIIMKYLYPLNEDKIHQEKVQHDLKNLRNNVVFGFFMTSALWIALSMQLQILQEDLKDTLFFKIPRWEISDDLAFEPLGLIFLAFFATILCVQFLGMFIHRWGTMLHMLSITDISCGKTFTEKDKVREIIMKSMELQKLCNIENEPTPDYEDSLPDYEPTDDEEYYESQSVVTSDSADVSTWSNNPPAYETMSAAMMHRNGRQDIFNRRGNASGAALRKAFEKRFRNEKQLHRMDADVPINSRMYSMGENDAASIV
ncbi:LOW QUALITY PROTEIN: chitin synthase chs-2-like [Ruditapes philippinarum]|uniref:LOW QUALITY PROTEIN: chitin synthase chs-2-like n=1 Tax=Ruditapes philippinarum TaxID=129788 RepID=UPI00295A618B|nr:LOW QUALITY PROTEIN: chitin synthase chs-2-like [Ruditapes philippinarum]